MYVCMYIYVYTYVYIKRSLRIEPWENPASTVAHVKW